MSCYSGIDSDMVIVKIVLKYNSNEDIIESIQKQNLKIVEGLYESNVHIEVKYRMGARNRQEDNVIMEVSIPENMETSRRRKIPPY